MGSVIGRIYGFENKVDSVGMKVAKAAAKANLKANMKRNGKHIGMSKKRMLIAEAEAKMLASFEEEEKKIAKGLSDSTDENEKIIEENKNEVIDSKTEIDNDETSLNDDYDTDGMLSPEKKVLLDEFLGSDENRPESSLTEENAKGGDTSALPQIENVPSKSPRTQINDTERLKLPSI